MKNDSKAGTWSSLTAHPALSRIEFSGGPVISHSTVLWSNEPQAASSSQHIWVGWQRPESIRRIFAASSSWQSSWAALALHLCPDAQLLENLSPKVPGTFKSRTQKQCILFAWVIALHVSQSVIWHLSWNFLKMTKKHPLNTKAIPRWDICSNFNRANKIRNISLSCTIMSNPHILILATSQAHSPSIVSFLHLYFSLNDTLSLFYCLPDLLSWKFI